MIRLKNPLSLQVIEKSEYFIANPETYQPRSLVRDGNNKDAQLEDYKKHGSDPVCLLSKNSLSTAQKAFFVVYGSSEVEEERPREAFAKVWARLDIDRLNAMTIDEAVCIILNAHPGEEDRKLFVSKIPQGFFESDFSDVVRLAKIFHEAGREAVEKGAVINKNPSQRFLEWDEITEVAREGRRIQARYLLARRLINLDKLKEHTG